jgi:predicted RNase H-like HicB family nuclease
MRYPIVIEPGSNSQAFGVVVPDLPGCFSAGDTLEEAITQAEEAIAGWIDAALDSGMDIPNPSDLNTLRSSSKTHKNWIWALASIDPVAALERHVHG